VIEKYFELGVRFRWNKPANVDGPRDGKVVDSVRPAAPLVYIGLGDDVSPRLMGTHVSQLGLRMNLPIQHQWLDYAPGRTARVPIGPYDVLTGYMSGCIIARWSEKGVNYVGHVGTVESDAAVNRTVKRAFGFAMPKTTTGFNPANAWQIGDLSAIARKGQPRLFALVTSSGAFFSVAMMQVGASEWYCGGIKRVAPTSHDALKMYMMHDD
jgi:hypothetical protein